MQIHIDLDLNFPNPKNNIQFIQQVIHDLLSDIRNRAKPIHVQLYHVIKHLLDRPGEFSSMINAWLPKDLLPPANAGCTCYFFIQHNRLYMQVLRLQSHMLSDGEYFIVYFSALALLVSNVLEIPLAPIFFKYDHLIFDPHDEEELTRRRLHYLNSVADQHKIIIRRRPIRFQDRPGYSCEFNIDYYIFQFYSKMLDMRLKDFEITKIK